MEWLPAIGEIVSLGDIRDPQIGNMRPGRRYRIQVTQGSLEFAWTVIASPAIFEIELQAGGRSTKEIREEVIYRIRQWAVGYIRLHSKLGDEIEVPSGVFS